MESSFWADKKSELNHIYNNFEQIEEIITNNKMESSYEANINFL